MSAPERKKYEVWCSAHEECARANHETPVPRYGAGTRREADALKRQADRECATPGARHEVRKTR